ncbi:MAG: ABC transporter permease [Phycisphaerae bacterium]|nr:ABC transporter permease [Phycisphaerae bacterium]
MTILEQLSAISRNTFVESIRQPIVLVVAVIATILIILSNPLSAFTLDDDQRMFVDIGLSTVFISMAVVASFIATNVIGREIDNRTVLTVVSKPVSRPVFVLGKYLGVAGALLLVFLYLSFTFLLVEMHGVLKTVRTPVHQPVLLFGTLAVLVGIGSATWMNYFYGKSFASSALLITTPAAGIAYLLAMLFSPEFGRNSMEAIFTGAAGEKPVFEVPIWTALGMLVIGVLMLASIAVAASTRLGQVLTLSVTIGVLMLGLLSDWLFARPAHALASSIARNPELATMGTKAKLWGLEALYAITPNFQVFWLADAINQDRAIPFAYVARTAPYGLLMIAAALCIAVALFQRREVG